MIKIAIVLSSALMLINADEAYDTSIKLEKPENEGRSLQVLSDLKYVFHAYQECSSNDVTTCLKLKLLKTMDRIARSDKELQLSDGISFIKDISNKQETSNDINVDDAINNLPRSSGEKNEVLDNLLFHKTMNYFKGHILQVNIFEKNRSFHSKISILNNEYTLINFLYTHIFHIYEKSYKKKHIKSYKSMGHMFKIENVCFDQLTLFITVFF